MKNFIKNLWGIATALPRWIVSAIAWAWQNLEEFFRAFHSVFRLERLFWALLYCVIAVGGYTTYAWAVTAINGLDWSLKLARQIP